MNRIAVMTALAVLAVSGWEAVMAADISLTLENDVEVVLHDNQTWSCANSQWKPKLVNMTITLEDGKEVYLDAKGRWSYVVESRKGQPQEALTVLYHTGSAKGTDIQQTVKHATDLAITGLTKRIRPHVDKRANESDVRACVEDMEKQVEQQERIIDGVIEVKMKLTVNQAAIDGIKECVELAIRLEEKMKQDSVSAH